MNDKTTTELVDELAIAHQQIVTLKKELELECSNESAAFLQDILNSISYPFYVIDVSDYRIVLANRATR